MELYMSDSRYEKFKKKAGQDVATTFGTFSMKMKGSLLDANLRDENAIRNKVSSRDHLFP